MRSRHRRIFAAVAASALASMALVVSAAEATPPAAPYQDFAGCPSPKEDENVAFCFKYEFTGGHLQLGKRNVAITNPILFRGGQRQISSAFSGNSEAGIVPARQPVEGGLVGVTGMPKLDEAVANKNQLKVYAVVESAGTPGQLGEFPLTLPIKVHLENPLLGSTCYIGSNANPIVLNLTTGTTSPPSPNKPITGVQGSELESEASRPEVLLSSGGTLVDNAYAVPAASGCQLNYGQYHANIDKYVNAAAGLPSAAGRNTTSLNYSFSVVDPRVVYP